MKSIFEDNTNIANFGGAREKNVEKRKLFSLLVSNLNPLF